MLTLGIDLASDPKKTGVCLVDWRTGRPVVRKTGGKGDDDELRRLIQKSDKVGIDVPLGWPTDLVSAVSAWSKGSRWPTVSKASLRYRDTDHGPGRPPLSVSSDRLAVPAFRAAALLSSLNLHDQRDGRGKVVEVYPVASLRAWLEAEPAHEYKRPDASGRRARRELLTRLLRGLGHEPGRFSAFREDCYGGSRRLRCIRCRTDGARCGLGPDPASKSVAAKEGTGRRLDSSACRKHLVRAALHAP